MRVNLEGPVRSALMRLALASDPIHIDADTIPSASPSPGVSQPEPQPMLLATPNAAMAVIGQEETARQPVGTAGQPSSTDIGVRFADAVFHYTRVHVIHINGRIVSRLTGYRALDPPLPVPSPLSPGIHSRVRYAQRHGVTMDQLV